MPSFGYEEECGASVGVGGWKSCTNRNCSCNQCDNCNSSTGTYSYYQDDYPTNKISTFKIKTLNLEQIYSTEKALLFKVKEESLPKNVSEITLWIPKYCMYNTNSEIHREYTYKLKFKITSKPKVTHSVVENSESYRGLTAQKIFEKLSLTVKNIADIGFSKTQIYYTVKEVAITEQSFFNYIKEHHTKLLNT